MSIAEEFEFDPSKVWTNHRPFLTSSAIVGANYGDEGKGKMVDAIAEKYKKEGYKILSARGQGSGNAGHTVVVNGKKMDFHYLTSAGLSADAMLLGPGMLIDPIRLLEEIKKLPEEKQSIVLVAERAAIVTDVERAMDVWCENKRKETNQKIIGTTGSGVGPGVGNRGYRFHVTFADALKFKTAEELKEQYLKNPILPEEVKAVLTDEYAEELLNSIRKLNIIDSVAFLKKCRSEDNWALILEVSQGMGLDPLFGHEGHNVTSTPCTIIGAASGLGLSQWDMPEEAYLMVKAYTSKVGGGKLITKHTPKEEKLSSVIYDMVGERGVTTGRKRDVGWFDAVLTRYAMNLNQESTLCVNCMDVIPKIAKLTDRVPICVAYRNTQTGEVTYDYPYHVSDYEPVYQYVEASGKTDDEIISDYIKAIELYTGGKVVAYGVGPGRDALIWRK